MSIIEVFPPHVNGIVWITVSPLPPLSLLPLVKRSAVFSAFSFENLRPDPARRDEDFQTGGAKTTAPKRVGGEGEGED